MKTKFYALIAMAMFLTACSSDGSGSGNNGGQGNAFLKASSGWTKIGEIPYTLTYSGLPGSHAMTPYDITFTGGELALIYSEDYKLQDGQYTKPFKVKFTPGGTIPAGTELQRGGYVFCDYTRFIPGSFTPVSMKIENIGGIYTCGVYSEEAGLIGGNNLGYLPPFAPMNWYPDGGLTMSVKYSGTANGNISDALSYKYPDTGNFTVTENQWSLDNTHWIQTSALRLSGGEINQFIVSYEGSKVYFSMIKDDPNAPNITQHNFFMLARQEMHGLAAENFMSGNIIIASNVVNDKYTVLLGEAGQSAGGNPIIKKVHCYQWQKGSDQFTRLYGDITVTEDIGANLMARTYIGSRPVTGNGAPVKFTPDGTAYMLYNYSPSNYVQNDQYTALATMNASGAKVMGKYSMADYPDTYDTIGLGVCEYSNGAYYAVVFQKNEDLYNVFDPEFRMEIVKLVP